MESPLYNYIEINGVITFKQDAPVLHLRAKYIFIRAGELHIGNQTAPYLGSAKITLSGEMANQEIVYENAVEAGNKILANVGLISIYGAPKISRTRLTQTVNAKSNTIYVEGGLDWVAGNMIGLAPTTMNWFETDYAIITSYDNTTGLVVLDRQLTYYHWG